MAATIIVAPAIAALWIYTAASKKRIGESQDERSERCSLLATQNAFMATVLPTAFVIVAVQMGWLIDAIVGLRSIWLLGTAAYLLSYLVYKRTV